MRLILVDRLNEERINFEPLVLSRPIFDLRCGFTSLGEKLIAKTGAKDVACFVPDYMADAWRETSQWPVNDAKKLTGDDLLLVHGRVRASEFHVAATGPSSETKSSAKGLPPPSRLPPKKLRITARLASPEITAAKAPATHEIRMSRL